MITNRKEAWGHFAEVFLSLCLMPYIIEAQTFRTFANGVINLLNLAATFIMALALLGFIIGAIRFIGTSGDDKSRESGKQLMIWGTLALFLMVAVWGVVRVLTNTFFGT